MYYDYDKPMADKLTEKQIEVYEHLLGLVPEIEKALLPFDGKIVNRRISTALGQVARGVCFDKSPYSGRWELTVQEWDNRSVNGEPDKYGVCRCQYIKDYKLYFADSASGDSFIDDQGRLQAGKLIAAIEKRREHYQGKIENMKEQFSRIGEIIAEYKRIQALKDAFSRDIDYSIRDYYGLKV